MLNLLGGDDLSPPPGEIQPPPHVSGMSLLWHDEFDSLNIWHPTNNPNGLWRNMDHWQDPLAEGYVDFAFSHGFNVNSISTNPDFIPPLNPLTVSNSILSIKAQRTSAALHPAAYARINEIANDQDPGLVNQVHWLGNWITAFTSATDSSHKFKYGYVEARIKHADTKGQGAAFWLYEAADATGREIDICEILGYKNTWFFNLHPSGTQFIHNQDIANSFHTYGLWWAPTFLRVYRDNVLMDEVTGSVATNYNGYMRVILSKSYDATWFVPAQMSDANDPSPAFTEVDWVRVWQ